jgi:hypothetical protein
MQASTLILDPETCLTRQGLAAQADWFWIPMRLSGHYDTKYDTSMTSPKVDIEVLAITFRISTSFGELNIAVTSRNGISRDVSATNPQ